jgi:hypothetical protein
MYQLKATIKCPLEMGDEMAEAVRKCGISELEIKTIPYGKFIRESRLYWDYVFPEMKEDEKEVTYISYYFEDNAPGRKASHDTELRLGWIPQNLRYVKGE